MILKFIRSCCFCKSSSEEIESLKAELETERKKYKSLEDRIVMITKDF